MDDTKAVEVALLALRRYARELEESLAHIEPADTLISESRRVLEIERARQLEAIDRLSMMHERWLADDSIPF